jgi:hypothetical protein
VSTLLDLPGDMRAAASQLDRDIRETMLDVDARREQLSRETAGGWDAFVQEWAHFTEQDQGAGQGWLYGSGTVNWWGASSVSMDAINAHRAQLIKWRSRIASDTGAALSSPDVEKPAPPTDPLMLGKLSSLLPWALGAVAFVYVLPLLPPILKGLKGLKR